MPWRSAGKPLTALLVLKQVEADRLKLSTQLEELLEQSCGTDKATVTVSDLLTHQSGFPKTATGWPQSEWRESIAGIIDTPREFDIGSAAYHPQSSWFLLGEILLRQNAEPAVESFTALLQRDLLDPLGMTRTFCGIPSNQIRGLSDDLPVLYVREQGRLAESFYFREPWLNRASPGGNLRGPIRELGRFYEMLLNGGRLPDGRQFVSESTVRLMTARHRIGMFDETFQHVMDFGLGVICDSKRYGPETVPYGFGSLCSEFTFGHGGSQCSIGFCDPARQLVVAWSANGFCGEGQHQRRNRMINDAVYRDLGIV